MTKNIDLTENYYQDPLIFTPINKKKHKFKKKSKCSCVFHWVLVHLSNFVSLQNVQFKNLQFWIINAYEIVHVHAWMVYRNSAWISTCMKCFGLAHLASLFVKLFLIIKI